MRCVIFDLDGTLYRCDELAARYQTELLNMGASRLGLDPARLRQGIGEIQALFVRHFGSAPGGTALLPAFGIGLSEWACISEEQIDPREYVEPDQRLRDALVMLINHGIRSAIVTNNSRTQTLRTLEALGINDLFDIIINPMSADELKPSTHMYIEALAMLGIRPEHCVVIGDRDNVDLEPARRLGMTTVRVAGPADTIGAIMSFLSVPSGR